MSRRLKADILAENKQLRMRLAELETPRARSRSPRREAETVATTYRALDQVCKFERDDVVQELKETIVKQQMEIQNLKEGQGQIGELLLSIKRKENPAFVDNFVIEHTGKSTMSVAEWVSKMDKLVSATRDMVFWGRCNYNLTFSMP